MPENIKNSYIQQWTKLKEIAENLRLNVAAPAGDLHKIITIIDSAIQTAQQRDNQALFVCPRCGNFQNFRAYEKVDRILTARFQQNDQKFHIVNEELGDTDGVDLVICVECDYEFTPDQRNIILENLEF